MQSSTRLSNMCISFSRTFPLRLTSESEPLGSFPVLAQKLPNLRPRSKVDLHDITRVGILVLKFSLICQFGMSSGDVHDIKVLSSKDRDGGVLEFRSVDITDDFAFWGVADNSSVLESRDPDVSKPVHC